MNNIKATILDLLRVSAGAACLAGAVPLQAASTSQHTVSITVMAINEIAITGSPSLTINTATAGARPDTDSGDGQLKLTTNETGKKITVQLDSALPTGLTLRLESTATDEDFEGEIPSLDNTPKDLVTGLANKATDDTDPSGVVLTYVLTATQAAEPEAGLTRTVTFTLTDEV